MKRITALTLVLFVAGCGEEVVQPPPEADIPALLTVSGVPVVLNYETGTIGVDFSKLSEPEPTALESGPKGGFPLVVVTTGIRPPVDAPVVNNFEDALRLVQAGGMIIVLRGTHVVEHVVIDKPVTIKGQPGALIEHGQGGYDSTFRVKGVQSGTLTFESLTFKLPSAPWTIIDARGVYDQVVVRDCTFELGTYTVSGVFGGGSTVPGAKVTVQDSRFRGGLVGPFASGEVEFDVLNNVLSEQTFGGIQLQDGAIGRIEGNVIDGCGGNQCIVALGTVHVEVLGNRVMSDEGTAIGISNWGVSAGGDFHIAGNEVIGVDGGSGAYAFGTGIHVYGHYTGLPFTGIISDNVVSNAEIGIHSEEGGGPVVVQGSGNVLVNIGTGFVGDEGHTINIQSSDITDYVVPMNADDDVSQINASDLTCNWWGAATGPQNVPVGVDPTVYTPWATGPVAGTSTTECTGGL